MDKGIVDVVYKRILDNIKEGKHVIRHVGIRDGYHVFEGITFIDRDKCDEHTKNKLIELI